MNKPLFALILWGVLVLAGVSGPVSGEPVPVTQEGAAAVAVSMAPAVDAAARPTKAPEVHKAESDNGSAVTLHSHQALIVSLPENAGSTGFCWSVEAFDPAVLEQLDSAYQHPSFGKLPMVGAPGTRMFRFIGKRAGHCDLRLHLSRPWEHAVKPAKVYDLKVAVEGKAPSPTPPAPGPRPDPSPVQPKPPSPPAPAAPVVPGSGSH